MSRGVWQALLVVVRQGCVAAPLKGLPAFVTARLLGRTLETFFFQSSRI